MRNRILSRAQDMAPELVRIRRAIHRHPELSFQEHQTAALVAETLDSMGILVETGVGKTGVVGHLGTEGPIVGLRADMDALPIQELNQVDYASEVPGVMHACGHDVHTACLLGAASLLTKVDLEGQVRFLFQPSEEGMDAEGKSGAMRMIDDGALQNVSAVFGLHVHASYPAGTLICTPGAMAASLDDFHLIVKGKAAHGAYAHEGLDAVLLAAQVVTALHTIVARKIPAVEGGVISVGTIHGGTKENNLADRVEMTGTIRSLDVEVRKTLHQELERVCELTRALGGDYELGIRGGYPPLVNDPALTSLSRKIAVELVGEEAVHQRGPEMGGEDFSFFTQLAPGCFLELGVQAPAGPMRPLHNPNFDIDESALPLGAAVLAALTLAYLEVA